MAWPHGFLELLALISKLAGELLDGLAEEALIAN
jgi:hypothetical protein